MVYELRQPQSVGSSTLMVFCSIMSVSGVVDDYLRRVQLNGEFAVEAKG